MKAWFASLQERERLILLCGGVAAAIIIAWIGLLRPLNNGTTELRDSVATKQRLLIDIARVEALGGGGAGPARATAQSLVVLIDSTSKGNGIVFTRSRPDGPDAINVSFERVSFDALLDWLVALDAEHGVTVESASFSSARDRGLVNGQLSLRRL